MKGHPRPLGCPGFCIYSSQTSGLWQGLGVANLWYRLWLTAALLTWYQSTCCWCLQALFVCGVVQAPLAISVVSCCGRADAVTMAAFGRGPDLACLSVVVLQLVARLLFLVDNTVSVCAPANRTFGIGSCGLLCLVMAETLLLIGLCLGCAIRCAASTLVLACGAST